MIKTFAACDTNGYCSNNKVPMDQISDWYEIVVNDCAGVISVTVSQVGDVSPAHTSLLACSATHAEEVVEKEISKFLYKPKPLPVAEQVPTPPVEPESDIPF